MKTFTSNDAKQRFGELIERALQEPVSITRHGRPSVVVTSDADYREYLELKHATLKAEVRRGFESIDRGEVSTRSFEEIAEDVLKRRKSTTR